MVTHTNAKPHLGNTFISVVQTVEWTVKVVGLNPQRINGLYIPWLLCKLLWIKAPLLLIDLFTGKYCLGSWFGLGCNWIKSINNIKCNTIKLSPKRDS